MDEMRILHDLVANSQRKQPQVEITDVGDTDENDEICLNLDGKGNIARAEEPRAADVASTEKPKQGEQDILFDGEDAVSTQVEQIGVMMSAFFQDDNNRNVVEAITQNSKVQMRLCKALERIADSLCK
ncbi:g682 [Coccomyxa elongata]